MDDATMTAVQWLQMIGLGGVAGALGQMVRALVGLKKVSDESAQLHQAESEMIQTGRLLATIALGFTAGSLAAISVGVDPAHVSSTQFFGLVGAGYSGADFVEGFVKRSGSRFMPDPSRVVVDDDDYLG